MTFVGKKVDCSAFALQLFNATGFRFDVPLNGKVQGGTFAWDLSVTVAVYETIAGPGISTATFNQGLKDLITDTWNNYTP